MADSNISITSGSGTEVDTRTEATNGHHRQVIVIGDPSTNAGVAPVDGTAGVKVNLGADNDVTVTGTVDLGSTDNAVLDAIEADTTTLAGAVDGTEMQVDVVSSALPSGAATESKQDTMIGHVDGIEALLGTIDADTSALVGTVDGDELQVDVVSSTLPSGAATSANQTTIIGHLDGVEGLLGTIDGDTGAIKTATEAIQAAVETSGGLVVNLGSNNDVTVTGTVTAELSSTDNGVLDNIDADLTTLIGHVDGVEALLGTIDADTSALAGAVDGSEVQVDVVSLPNTITGIGHGVTTVTTAGTDVALASSTACKRVSIQAQTDNTGLIAVGGSGVDATVASGSGILLYPGDVFEFEIDNLADVYIDATVNGEGARYTYFT